jgi:uncharacterized membrane protein YkvA (DUF1232 family)
MGPRLRGDDREERLAGAFFRHHLCSMNFQWAGFRNTLGGDAGNESLVRRSFWRKTSRLAARLPFAGDLLAAYYCAFDRDTPLHVKTALIAALAYFVLPADAVPDFLPALGYTDDAAVVVGAVRLLSDHIRPLHRDAARNTLAKLQSR